jgi:hypothetical protein
VLLLCDLFLSALVLEAEVEVITCPLCLAPADRTGISEQQGKKQKTGGRELKESKDTGRQAGREQ